jgi:hypothetical protein
MDERTLCATTPGAPVIDAEKVAGAHPQLASS